MMTKVSMWPKDIAANFWKGRVEVRQFFFYNNVDILIKIYQHPYPVVLQKKEKISVAQLSQLLEISRVKTNP